ncbi:hypothetical protein D3C87_652870 [compost metagenome]
MKRNKILFGLAALVIAFGLIFTTSAFKSKTSTKSFTYWQYEPGTMTGIRDASNYTPIAEPIEQPCESGEDLPCVLRVDESIDDEGKLDAYLNNLTTFPSDQDIVDHAIYKKLQD